ncbi:MAG: ABC transporter permease [Gemmatimonadaceae bacterium]
MIRRLIRLPSRSRHNARADARAELDALIEQQVRFYIACGRTPSEAHAEAVRRLGGGAAMNDVYAEVERSAAQRQRGLGLREWMHDAQSDVRVALRAWRRAPAMALAAVVTLSLAIGATSAIYSAVHAVLWRPLPVRDQDRLVAIWEENPDFGWVHAEAAPANMLDWKERARGFSDVAAYATFSSSATIARGDDPRRVNQLQATGNLFQVLGVTPILGRTFRAEETWSNAAGRLALISYKLWNEGFAADSSIVGHTIKIDGRDVEVVGVLPPGFALPGVTADVWRPMRWDPEDRSKVFFRRAHWLMVIARLADGATFVSANAELQRVVTSLKQEYPETNVHMGAGMTPLHDYLVGETRLPLLVTFGGAALLLIIACANVANLLLVRASAVHREQAVRLALGASRSRLLRQALADGMVLAGLGGLGGLLLGTWGTRALMALQPEGLLPVSGIDVSWATMGFAGAVVVALTLVFAAVPVWWSRRMLPSEALREEGRGASAGQRATRGTNLLLAGQVAIALVLTASAGLLIKSYFRLDRVDPGVDTRNVLTTEVTLPSLRYDSATKVIAFFDRLVEEARALPGVQGAAVTSKVALGPSSWSSQFAIEGLPPIEGTPQVVHREVTDGYNAVMRSPIREGRGIAASDQANAPAVVVVNETFARRFAPAGGIIGRRIAFDATPGPNTNWRTVVGVSSDEHQTSLAKAPEAEVFAPYAQEPRSAMTLIVRTSGPAAESMTAVRALIRRLDASLALGEMRTMEDVRAAALQRERFLATLLLGFAGVGLVLGLVGVYGIVSQIARRRLREMGIRMALGAHRREVEWLLVRKGVAVSAVGAVVGIFIGVLSTRVLRSLLYHVAPTDPLVYAGTATALLVAAALASWLPASRAARTDPSEVLRSD